MSSHYFEQATYHPGMDDNAVDAISAMQLMAQEYRDRHKFPDAQLEIAVPNHLARQLIAEYGSLQAAADTIFDPGAVVIVDRFWRDWCYDVQEQVNQGTGHLT
jgi:hypothetical protein